LALAALVLLGRGYWPAILSGAFFANAVTPIPLDAAAGIACGNAAEAWLGAWLVSRGVRGRPVAFGDLAAVRALVIAAPLSALVSAGAGIAALRLTGALPGDTQIGTAVALWWGGTSSGRSCSLRCCSPGGRPPGTSSAAAPRSSSLSAACSLWWPASLSAACFRPHGCRPPISRTCCSRS
jgi:integral membrane sensor domain MASE1